MSLILLKCGDIELKRGPFSESFSILNTETELSAHTLKDIFTVVHYNVQSLLNKTDIIQLDFSCTLDAGLISKYKILNVFGLEFLSNTKSYY